MKRQERFTDAPFVPIGQLFQRYPSPVANNTPFLGHEFRNSTSAILGPRTPPLRRSPDGVAPAGIATGRPTRSIRRGQNEPIRLGAFQNQIGQREYIRRPLEQLVPDRAT